MVKWQPILWNYKDSFIGKKFIIPTVLEALKYPVGVILPCYFLHTFLTGSIYGTYYDIYDSELIKKP